MRRTNQAGYINRYKPVRAWCVNRGSIDTQLIMATRKDADTYDQLECGPFPVIIADARHFRAVSMDKVRRLTAKTSKNPKSQWNRMLKSLGLETKR